MNPNFENYKISCIEAQSWTHLICLPLLLSPFHPYLNKLYSYFNWTYDIYYSSPHSKTSTPVQLYRFYTPVQSFYQLAGAGALIVPPGQPRNSNRKSLQ